MYMTKEEAPIIHKQIIMQLLLYNYYRMHWNRHFISSCMKNLDQVLYDEIASREESKHENTANTYELAPNKPQH